jgi:predicted dithiol-disulfide oxidoreductase (DUF899 family)
MPIQRYWFNDGPLLPIEFACHSTKDRITAVIVPGVRRVRSLWAIMTVNDVDAARKTGGSANITQQVNLAVVAKVPIEQFRAHAKSRGWRHARLLSSASNAYNRDSQGEAPDGTQTPNANVFLRRDGKVHHLWSSELYHAPVDPGQDMRHVDFMWPMWSAFDRTPGGRGTDWRPKLDYF